MCTFYAQSVLTVVAFDMQSTEKKEKVDAFMDHEVTCVIQQVIGAGNLTTSCHKNIILTIFCLKLIITNIL